MPIDVSENSGKPSLCQSRRDSEKETIQRRGANMSIQEECLWSQALGPGINCTNYAATNAIVNSSDVLVFSELIATALEGKDFDEDIQVRK